MRVLLATLRTAIANSLANRSSFILQASLMVINDITWLIFWGLFFSRTGSLRGWGLADLMVLFSMLLTSGGLALGVFANSRLIGRLAAEGAFDETLVLPVSPLGYTLARRIDAPNIGDLLFGPVLFLVAGHPTPERILVFAAGALIGAVVLVSFLVICGAFTFFVGGGGEQGELGVNALIVFSSYPLDFFGGLTKLLLFTVVPAAFVTGLPVRLVNHFDLGLAILLPAVAAGFALSAGTVFTFGMRRYSSGSLWIH